MNQQTRIRTPLHRQPITLAFKALQQKVYRHLHCMECGMPFLDITDKVLIASDAETPVEQLRPNELGVVTIHCPRHQCKQYYNLDLAV